MKLVMGCWITWSSWSSMTTQWRPWRNGNRHIVTQYSNVSHDYPMIIPWLSHDFPENPIQKGHPKKKKKSIFFLFKSHGNHHIFWLVVDLPLGKIWVRQLGWWHSQKMESHKIPWFQTTNQMISYQTLPLLEVNHDTCWCFFWVDSEVWKKP